MAGREGSPLICSCPAVGRLGGYIWLSFRLSLSHTPVRSPAGPFLVVVHSELLTYPTKTNPHRNHEAEVSTRSR